MNGPKEPFSQTSQPADQPNSGDKVDANNPKASAGRLTNTDVRQPDYKPPTGITLVNDWYDSKYGRG